VRVRVFTCMHVTSSGLACSVAPTNSKHATIPMNCGADALARTISSTRASLHLKIIR
jgi:hypothetical protein